ncbi:MAG TPA: hypothetical protein VEJ68_03515, partial [Candidatus Bathyarchaeia archaeon]|nr:hypothetical protein [Candidatus Bathyarchaeia archaeon]
KESNNLSDYSDPMVLKTLQSMKQMSSEDNPFDNVENHWTCLDKDGIAAGYVVGADEHEAVRNYVNCAAGGSCFDTPVCILTRGNVRLDVADFIIFLRVKKMPNGPLIGMINPNKWRVDDKQPKSIEEIISTLETSFPSMYEVVNDPLSR